MPSFQARRIIGSLLLFLTMSQSLCLYGQGQDLGFYVFFKKPDKWAQVYLYTWFVQSGKLVEPTGRWPGKALSDVAGWYRGYIDQSELDPTTLSINIIFNNAAGEQTPDLKREDNGWYVWKKQDAVVNQWFDLNPEERLFNVLIENGQGSGRYSPGTLVKIQALPPQPSLFVGWKGVDISLIADPTQKEAQFQMPDRDVSLGVQYEDLSQGQQQYISLCAKCHGKAGEGGVGTNLLLSSGKCKSCGMQSTLEDRIAATMPKGQIGQCTGDCAKNVARYIRFGLNTQDAVDCTAPSNKLGRRQLRLLSEREFRNVIRDVFGLTELSSLRFWPEPANVQGYNNNADSSIVSDRHLAVFVKAGREIAGLIKPTTLYQAQCGNDVGCVINQLGLKLFRRPLRVDEVAQYTDLWQSKSTESQAVLEAMLQSPYFLYRSELGSFISPMNAFSLDAYEIASALSFTLTGSSPDAQLLQAAADGSIKDPIKRRSEADRLLQSAAARATFGDFALQWLGVSNLPFVTRDNAKMTSNIRRDMLQETQRFFGDLIFDQNASVGDLYRADRTIASRELAAYYGLSVPATDWTPVAYDGNRRGLIAQGSILATYSNSAEASPIKRGVFVRNRLLCQELPPPPANVDTTIPAPQPGLTIRERLARHLSQGAQSDGSNSCASCHQYIDKVGFGFERFDEIGILRSVYQERPTQLIDISGEIKGPDSLLDSTVLPFQNFTELSELLASSPKAKECVAVQYLRYARGYVERTEDRCTGQSLQETLRQDKSVRQALVEFVSADSFVWRK